MKKTIVYVLECNMFNETLEETFQWCGGIFPTREEAYSAAKEIFLNKLDLSFGFRISEQEIGFPNFCSDYFQGENGWLYPSDEWKTEMFEKKNPTPKEVDYCEFEKYIADTYGSGYIGDVDDDEDEQDLYCFCPECGEPIYCCDYPVIAKTCEDDGTPVYYCPICEIGI